MALETIRQKWVSIKKFTIDRKPFRMETGGTTYKFSIGVCVIKILKTGPTPASFTFIFGLYK